MGMTATMIRAWIDAVLKPMSQQWAREGLPLSSFGGILLGYGIKVLRGAGDTDDAIREAFELAMKAPPAS